MRLMKFQEIKKRNLSRWIKVLFIGQKYPHCVFIQLGGCTLSELRFCLFFKFLFLNFNCFKLIFFWGGNDNSSILFNTFWLFILKSYRWIISSLNHRSIFLHRSIYRILNLIFRSRWPHDYLIALFFVVGVTLC